MSKKIKILLTFLGCVVGFDIYAQGTLKIVNRASSQNLCLQVSPSGTAADALCIDGSSKIITAPAGIIHSNGSASIVATDADATLTSTSLPMQIYTGFSTLRNVTLPTTGVVAGAEYTLVNTTINDMVVKSSNGTALTVANGATSDATVERGFVRLRALVATPTTPAQWLVLHVYEEAQATITFTVGFTVNQNLLISFKRMNNLVTANAGAILATTTGSPVQITTAIGALPVRFRPNQTESVKSPVKVDNVGTPQSIPGCIVFESNGQVDIRLDYKSSTWSNGATTGFEGGFSSSYSTVQ